MGVCFSKKKDDPSSPTKIPSNDLPKEKSPAKKEPEAEEKPSLAPAEASEKESSQLERQPSTKSSETAEKKQLTSSSCSKEELDAILIQCGRLSRSSSGKASNGGQRTYSGSKRSYDFDEEKRKEEQRRSPNRGSRERRMSRSPGKRSDFPASKIPISDKQRQQQQPTKMVSVPAREKGAPLRSASPRSNENLSRSSSKKADQSPYRRNPLSVVEDNSTLVRSMRSRDEEIKGKKKGAESISHAIVTTKPQQKQAPKKQEAAEQEQREAKTGTEIEGQIPRTLPARATLSRASYNVENNPGFNSSYASMLIEGIQKQQITAFSLPACISKACSILDAVADLNSSCADRRSFETDHSSNNNNKYVTVRDTRRRDLEPQESAGSNSFSQWEMNSVDSMTCNNVKEVMEAEIDEVDQAGNQQHLNSRRSGATPIAKKRGFDQSLQQQEEGGKGSSLPVYAAATF